MVFRKLRDSGLCDPIADFLDKVEPEWDKMERRGNAAIDKVMKLLVETGEYNLVVQNCEHFAIWCKIGVYKSHQVDNIYRLGKMYKV